MSDVPAPHHAFDRLVEKSRAFPPLPIAVAAPTTEVALAGAILAARQGLIEPVLVGPEQAIRALAQRLDLDLGAVAVVDAEDDADSARKAVALCRAGKARALMKGGLHTDALMHAVLAHDSGLKTERRVSHVFVLDAPAYPRLLLITDAAINIYPTLEDKIDIVRNAIDVAHALASIRRPWRCSRRSRPSARKSSRPSMRRPSARWPTASRLREPFSTDRSLSTPP
jgi:phosphate acetyltransferase